MSVAVTARRTDDAHLPQPAALQHMVSPPAPDRPPAATHGPYSSTVSPHSHTLQLQQRRPGKPLEEHKTADPPQPQPPHVVTRVSTSAASSSSSAYSSASVSSNVDPQQYHAPHTHHDTSHHTTVSFAPIPAITALHAPHQPPHSRSPQQAAPHQLVVQQPPGALVVATSQSDSASYLPVGRGGGAGHSDTEEGEEVEEGGEEAEGEWEDEEEEDEEESVDDSPREGRILTFADEHGVQLCAFYVYDPAAVQNASPRPDKQAGGGGSFGAESDRRKEIAKATRLQEKQELEGGCQCCIS